MSDLVKRVSKALRQHRDDGNVRSVKDERGNQAWARRTVVRTQLKRQLCADIVEKVRNHAWPKCPPFHVLSECCRSMRSQFGYAPHTQLDRKIIRSPKSIFSIGLYGPPKNQTLWKTDFFNSIRHIRTLLAMSQRSPLAPLRTLIGNHLRAG